MDQKLAGLLFIIVIGSVLVGIAKLIQRGQAKPGVIFIILLMPLLFLFGIQIMEGGIPDGFSNISGEIVLGVIGSLIAGIILMGISKK